MHNFVADLMFQHQVYNMKTERKMIKITTEHGTSYLIDTQNNKAKRTPGGVNYMEDDDSWFNFRQILVYDREIGQVENDSDITLGKSVYFDMVGSPHYDWKITTNVIKIEEIDNE